MSGFKDSPQNINALFTFVSALETVVFWMCTVDYDQHLYVNNAYESIWGRPRESLLGGTTDWVETLVDDDYSRNEGEFVRRQKDGGGSTMGFRIHRPDGELRYLKNTSYTFCNKDKEAILIAGIDECLTPEAWHDYIDSNINSSAIAIDPQIKDFLEVIKQEYKAGILIPENDNEKRLKSGEIELPMQLKIADQEITISKRQSQCLYYLLMGNTAKETARKLGISNRSVELYLSVLKRKLGVRKKIDVIALILKYGLYQDFIK